MLQAMKLRKHVCAGLACAFAILAFSSAATPNGWLDDFDAAKAKAAAEGKKILIDFSGSDWCGFCIKLDKEVLSKRAFMSKASQSFVLLLVDSPRNKGLLSPKARKENPGLVSKFGIRGYPTLVITDATGREIARKVGYARGGPEGLLTWLNTASASNGNGAAEEALKRTNSKDATKRKPCGKDCCKTRICNCCRRNAGRCCPDNGAPPGAFTNLAKETEQPGDAQSDAGEMKVRHVNGYELRTDDFGLVKELEVLADFFEKVSTAFNRETGGYYVGQRHYYAGIFLHRDESMRGNKSKFIGAKNFYSMYLPSNIQDKSWCYFLCDSFLSRKKGAGQNEMQMGEQMLVYVGYRVAAALELDGAAATLARVGEDKKGVKRLMHELSKIKTDAISKYYEVKTRLVETERLGFVVPVHDVAEIFSGVVGRDVFDLFNQYGLRANREKVSPRLVGFAADYSAQKGAETP